MPLTLSDLTSATSDQLLHLVKRRHPEFTAENAEHWAFLEASFKGGRDWIEKNIFTYHKEGSKEFKKRKERAYRFPHSREVISLVNKYVFKGAIDRAEDVPAHIKEFWGASTLLKRPVADFMQAVSTKTSTFGRIWIVVDNNVPAGVKSEADRKLSKGRCYAYFLKPSQVYDFEYDDDGELEWLVNGEMVRSTGSPLVSDGVLSEQFRVWAKDFTCVIQVVKGNGTETASIRAGSINAHGLGLVPVFPADHVTSDEPYISQGLIEDVAYMDRTVANYLSNLDVIIQDQTFSQLAIPFQGLLPSDQSIDPNDPDGEPDETDQMLRMGTKRIFAYNAEGGSKPEFISPDVKQADIIMKAISKIVGEIYHSIGMAGERTKEDNAAGIDNSSGVAKAYDFEKLNAMLAAKARSLQNIEKNIVRIVNAWHGDVKELEQTEDYVSYPETFDVRNLTDEMDNAQRLSVMGAPKELRRFQMLRLAKKMFPQASESDAKKIADEIEKDWLEIDPATLAVGSQQAGPLPTVDRVPSKAGTGKKGNRQGENNKPAPK